MGSVLCTSQFGYGTAAGRLKSTGVHTPGTRTGALDELPLLAPDFSESGEPTRLAARFLRFSAAVMRKHATPEKRRVA